MKKIIKIITMLSIIIILGFTYAFGSTVYSGVSNASAVFLNMSYTDIGK